MREAGRRQGMDKIIVAWDNSVSDCCPETYTREKLTAPCPANDKIGDCNSFAGAPVRKKFKTQKSTVHNIA